MSKLNEINHPLIEHKLSVLREETTSTRKFRDVVSEIGVLMTYEITRDLKTYEVDIKTPVAEMTTNRVNMSDIVIVPILRAGLGMVEGVHSVIPEARIGHIGIYRDEKTLEAVEYFAKFPPALEEKDVIMVDPMLATGATAILAIDMLKKRGVKNIKFLCLVSCPEGVKALSDIHPDVDIYTAANDLKLNEKGYIVPGLGDAGDRIFGTL